MGWFWADNASDNTSTINSNILKCPVDHGKLQTTQQPSACPVVKNGSEMPLISACPVMHDKKGELSEDRFLNPMNNMPFSLSTEKAPGQKIDLPTERTMSTIPRGTNDNEGVWEYPSPQQMLNAMLRKGKGNVPEDAVESMVEVHNWLNEAAWSEILEWEKPHTEQTSKPPRLLKFVGKPDELSPRLKMYLLLSRVFPSRFNDNAPFDRHDWTIVRPNVTGDQVTPVRYVIDYYSGPDDEDTGLPTFYLDVRPALDSFGSAMDRFKRWNEVVAQPTLNKALGRDLE